MGNLLPGLLVRHHGHHQHDGLDLAKVDPPKRCQQVEEPAGCAVPRAADYNVVVEGRGILDGGLLHRPGGLHVVALRDLESLKELALYRLLQVRLQLELFEPARRVLPPLFLGFFVDGLGTGAWC